MCVLLLLNHSSNSRNVTRDGYGIQIKRGREERRGIKTTLWREDEAMLSRKWMGGWMDVMNVNCLGNDFFHKDRSRKKKEKKNNNQI